MTLVPDGSVGDYGAIIAAISALGTAAFGLVDATKAFAGGISNVGYGFIHSAVQPYEPALRLVNANEPYATIHANWLNGMAKADQKAAVKALVRLGLTPATAKSLAAGAPGVDPTTFQNAATKVADGTSLTDQEIAVLGRFDATIDAQLDAGFERADQAYRNKSKVLAAIIAMALAVLGGWLVVQVPWSAYFWSQDFFAAVLVGAIATPLAPVAKDITSAIGSAVNAFKAVRP